MTWVATRWDLTRLGLSAATLVPESRQATVADVSTCTFALPGHGFAGGEQLELAPSGAGAALPAGTTTIAAYLAKLLPSKSSRLFTLTDLAGNPITITDAGAGVLTVLVDIGPTVDAIMAAESSLIVARAKAYRGPWTTPPAWAAAMAADLAGPRVAKLLRVASPLYKFEDLMSFRAQALEQLEKMAKGEPMDDGTPAFDATPTVADAGAQVAFIHPGPFSAPHHRAAIGVADLTPDPALGRLPSTLGGHGDNV